MIAGRDLWGEKNIIPLFTITVVPLAGGRLPRGRELSVVPSSFIIAIRPPVLCSENHPSRGPDVLVSIHPDRVGSLREFL